MLEAVGSIPVPANGFLPLYYTIQHNLQNSKNFSKSGVKSDWSQKLHYWSIFGLKNGCQEEGGIHFK
jgi:hypothetical protein